MPKLETIVANPAAQPRVGFAPSAERTYDFVASGIGLVGDATQKIVDAERMSQTRAASASAERELYDLADSLNNSADYDLAEEMFESQSKQILDRYREELPDMFHREAFDESTGAFGERLRHGVRSTVRTKRVDAAKAGLDEELSARAGLYADLYDDPNGQAEQAKTFEDSVELQRANGLITEQDAVAYRDGFGRAAQKLTQGRVKQVRTHGRVLEVMASSDSKEAALKMADASDPEIAEDVFKRVKARWDAIATGRTDAVRAEIDQSYPEIDRAFTDGLQVGPGENDVVPPGPEAAYARLDQMTLTDDVRKKLEGRIGDLSRRHDLVDAGVFAREFDALVTQRDTEPQKFADAPLEDVRLRFPNYRTQIDSLIKDRNDIRQGIEPTATETKRATQLYADFFDVKVNATGINEQERRAKFQLAYELEYQQMTKAVGGRRLTREEERKLASDLLKPLIAGEEVYRFEQPPQLSPRARPPAKPGTVPAPVRPPPTPRQAQPFTKVDENVDLALQAEVAVFERTGKAPTHDQIVAEMNKMRGAAR